MFRQTAIQKLLPILLLLSVAAAALLIYPINADAFSARADNNCVIPESGPWPPCATGGGTAATPTPVGQPCPTSGKWPAGCIPPSAGAQPCPSSGKWPPGCVPPQPTTPGPTPIPTAIITPTGAVTPTQSASDGFDHVTQVTSGDTLVVNLNGGAYTVRLLGIDAPDAGESCATEATVFLSELVLNEAVRLEKDVSDVDAFTRLLRYVHLNATFVNAEMVSAGLAYARETPPDVRYSAELIRLENDARDAKRGCLWDHSLPVPPRQPDPTPTPGPTREPTAVPDNG